MKAEPRFTVWGKHDKTPRWSTLEHDLTGPEATAALIVRQDRVRRTGTPCRFVVLPVGERPK